MNDIERARLKRLETAKQKHVITNWREGALLITFLVMIAGIGFALGALVFG